MVHKDSLKNSTFLQTGEGRRPRNFLIYNSKYLIRNFCLVKQLTDYTELYEIPYNEYFPVD